MDEELKLVNKVVDVADRANRKNCVTLLPYNVDNPESCSPQIRVFARKKEDEKLQPIVHVNCTLEDFVYLHHVLSSVYDKVIIN